MRMCNDIWMCGMHYIQNANGYFNARDKNKIKKYDSNTSHWRVFPGFIEYYLTEIFWASNIKRAGKVQWSRIGLFYHIKNESRLQRSYEMHHECVFPRHYSNEKYTESALSRGVFTYINKI